MPTLGEELKRRREERNIALADIAEATRIGTRFLKAIEADNYSVLPGGIFTRSFIRAYAKQVGMDEDEAIALYQQQATGAPVEAIPPKTESRTSSPSIVEPPRTASPPKPRRSEPLTYTSSGNRTNWTTVVIIGGIAIFVIIIGLAVINKLRPSTPATPDNPPQRNAMAQANTNQSNSASTNTSAQTAQGTQAAPSVTQGEPLVVKLEATIDNCSLQYWIDDAPKPTSILIKKGDTQSLPPAQSQVRLNIGNRPAVKMSINNREAKFPDGLPNWGAKLTIGRDNLQTYFQ